VIVAEHERTDVQRLAIEAMEGAVVAGLDLSFIDAGSL
jgi:hypothetical protein